MARPLRRERGALWAASGSESGCALDRRRAFLLAAFALVVQLAVVRLAVVPFVALGTAATPGGRIAFGAFATFVSVVAATGGRYNARHLVALAAVRLCAGAVPALVGAALLDGGVAPASPLVYATDLGLAALGTVLADDQLDECGITLGEVHRVREAIVATLLDLHHRRVKYQGFNPPSRPDAR